MAADFARPWDAHAFAEAAGWLHDIGKFNPEFQRYLRESEAGVWQGRRGPDHKAAGAALASRSQLDALCFLIQGHHGGLHSRADLKSWLSDRLQDDAVVEAIRQANLAIPDLELRLRQVAALPPPNQFENEPTTLDLYLRMLFSALVDADFLDTERHFRPERDTTRGSVNDLASLWNAFQRDHTRLSETAEDTWVNRLRNEVYAAALDRATTIPGFFRLTGPTGIGKTRVSLGFALRHALAHNLKRVIYALPFTSITEQIAQEFRRIFYDHPSAVLEHHSAITPTEPDETPTQEEIWRRLTAENWDAPIVVTTTVQLFECLFAASPTRCRRLHNLARSVIILDEAQMLPTHVLTPILDALQQLVALYGATVVFCTATQPALNAAFRQLPVATEIVSQPTALFTQLKRVTYTLPASGERWSWEQVAETILAERQALAIVNTRADAVALLDTLRTHLTGDVSPTTADSPHDALFHLSTWMTGAHRRAVLAEVRRRLADDEPCWLVSTQVVEAGVDVDFPLVLRALAPLDRIVQAAGRCNRNGRLPGGGRVIVFVPEDGRTPRGVYTVGINETLTFLQNPAIDLHDPAVYERYFRAFYSYLDLDSKRVQETRHLGRLDFPETQKRFQMIEDDSLPVVITADAPGMSPNPAGRLLAQLTATTGNGQRLMRDLQPYIVGLPARQWTQAQARGLVQEVIPGLSAWHGQYDPHHGIELTRDLDPHALVW